MNSKFALNSMLTLLLLVSSCSEDDPEPQVIIDLENKTTGFVFSGVTSSDSKVVKYFEEMPSGIVDLSDGKDFTRFNPIVIRDNALFMTRTDGSSGFAKMVVNSEGEVVEEGIIPTIDPESFMMGIKDSETGVFQDRANSNIISIFNPNTLEVTGSINMSAAPVPGDIGQRYEQFIFRGNDIFAPIRGNENGDFFPSFIVHQANLSTKTFAGHTKREGNGVSPITVFRNTRSNLIDPMGDLYLYDAGSYGGTGVAARINKIPAGSDKIDPDYVFAPATVLNPTNIFLPTYNLFTILENGKAIAIVNQTTPQAAVDIVIAAGGLGNLSNENLAEITSILFSSESAVWCEIDLVAKTVTPIAGIPPVGVFSARAFFEHNGNMYLPAPTTLEKAYYKWNPTTGIASKAFVVTGVDFGEVYNIERNY